MERPNNQCHRVATPRYFHVDFQAAIKFAPDDPFVCLFFLSTQVLSTYLIQEGAQITGETRKRMKRSEEEIGMLVGGAKKI